LFVILGVIDIWKHSEGVFWTPWRVYWYLCFYLLFLCWRFLVSVDNRCSFLLLFFSEPKTLFILYDRCRVPRTSIRARSEIVESICLALVCFVRYRFHPRRYDLLGRSYLSLRHSNRQDICSAAIHTHNALASTKRRSSSFHTIHVSAVYHPSPSAKHPTSERAVG
jgi:hypothetical protein